MNNTKIGHRYEYKWNYFIYIICHQRKLINFDKSFGIERLCKIMFKYNIYAVQITTKYIDISL